jgi:hypothetical protein
MRSKKVKDADLARVKPALLRAAQQARRTAAATFTPLVIYKDGRTTKLAVVKEKRSKYGK